MKDLIRTNNPPLISFVESLLKEMGVFYFIADRSMSGAEGTIGAFPKRILVNDEDYLAARAFLTEAGLGDELRPLKP
ncbi:MAG: DUF2007 domain-containing protein [Asticcacaulis sp.]